jgi:hypothetical protein
VVSSKHGGMAEFSLPAPWGAPTLELSCARCGRTTHHYGRCVTLMADDDSDRRGGQIDWFCIECGHKHEPARVQDQPPLTGDDDGLTELFDRH